MKVFRIFSRNVRDSFKSVFRNISLSLASISCITITLIVVAISILLSVNVNNFANLVEKDVTIVTFLNVDVNEEGRQAVLTKIRALDNIETVTFQSKMDIASDMMKSSDQFKHILSSYTAEDSPIQDTYLVKVKDIEKIADTAKQIKEIESVNLVKYGEGMVEQLVSVFDMIRKIGIGVVVALVIVTAFLITNTIKITIYSRRREIEIMRLVGASNVNIKIPFVFEGLFLGILGAIIPIVATTYGYLALYNRFDGQLFSPFIRLVEPQPFIYVISLVLLVLGILVGMFGSWQAVRKYLKI